jgi:hypothetical protein
MSAVHRPNRNFENETREHIPYSVMMTGSLQSAYERFRTPKKVTEKPKKKKKALPDPVITTMNKWFK